jgi:DNA-binding response OmpR family regulator
MSNKKRIVLVDDDDDFVKSVKDLLEANHYEVLVARDGASGMALAIKEKFDLMILDVMMATDIEGIEISRKIAEIPELKRMPVVMITGMRKAKNLPFSIEPDADWLPVRVVLEKPVQPDVLLMEIQRLMIS